MYHFSSRLNRLNHTTGFATTVPTYIGKVPCLLSLFFLFRTGPDKRGIGNGEAREYALPTLDLLSRLMMGGLISK